MHSQLSASTSVLTPSWTVVIYRVTSPDRQRTILQRLRSQDPDQLTLLGSTNGRDAFVVAECRGPREEALLDHVVTEVDAEAARVYTSGPPGPLVSFVRGDDVL